MYVFIDQTRFRHTLHRYAKALYYDQITTGMTKAQVERILGPPTTVETKDMMIFKKTTYRYEDGKKFAMFTFKNDELDSKEGNLQREP